MSTLPPPPLSSNPLPPPPKPTSVPPTTTLSLETYVAAYGPKLTTALTQLRHVAAAAAPPVAPSTQTLPPPLFPSPPKAHPTPTLYDTPIELHDQQITALRTKRTALQNLMTEVQQLATLHATITGDGTSTTTNLHSHVSHLSTEAASLHSHLTLLQAPLKTYTAVHHAAHLLNVSTAQLEGCYTLTSAGNGRSTLTITPPSRNQLDHGNARVAVGSDAFQLARTGVNDAIKFFKSHHTYKDASIWLGKCQYLRCVIAGYVNSAALERIERAAGLCASSGGGEAVMLETLPVYTKFGKVANGVRELIRPEGEEEGGEVINVMLVYAAFRKELVRPYVMSYGDNNYSVVEQLQFVRLVPAYMRRVERLERGLWEQFFGRKEEGEEGEEGGKNEDEERAVLRNFMTQLFEIVHGQVRGGIIREKSKDVLCQIVQIVKDETVSCGGESQVTTDTMRRIGQDAQERLIFVVLKELREEVGGYKAKGGDLEVRDRRVEGGEEEEVGERWYPPLKSTLVILSKIYGVVEMKVFDDIARNAVQQCVEAVARAGALLRAQKGVLGCTEWDGDLFLIQNLLNLREQLAPFALELRGTERQLDFSASHVTKAFGNFMNNRRQMFMLSRDNALLNFGSDIVPTVNSVDTDKKQELEDALKQVVMGLVESVVRKVVGAVEGVSMDLEGVMSRSVSVLGGLIERLRFFLDEGTVKITVKSIQSKICQLVGEAVKHEEDEGRKGRAAEVVAAVKNA